MSTYSAQNDADWGDDCPVCDHNLSAWHDKDDHCSWCGNDCGDLKTDST